MDSWTWKERFLLAVVPRAYALVLALLSFTIRKKELYAERPKKVWDGGQYLIGAFWHQRLLMMPFIPFRGRAGMLISQHLDGEFITRAVRPFGIDSVRGSTTRGSLSALRGMVRYYQNGGNLAITPDGPQGPRHKVQMGVIELAKQTGAPLFPVAYGASRKIVFNSWDRFILPLPFCRVVFLWGEPVFVPRDSDRRQMEERRQELEERLLRLTEEADLLFPGKS
jgi:lysophospholipid acyltransferase (LPLAT)-like uncharacterized protein